MNTIPIQGGQLPPVVANPVPIGQVPQVPDESAFLHSPAPAMPDMSGLSTFGASVKKYMTSQGAAQSKGLGMSSGQAAYTASLNAGPTPAPSVLAGAYGTPPPFGGVPVPTAPTAAPTPPLDTQGGP